MLARTARFPIFGLALPRTITIEDYDLTWVFVPSPSQRLQHSIDGVLLQPSTSHEKGVLCQDFPLGTNDCNKSSLRQVLSCASPSNRPYLPSRCHSQTFKRCRSKQITTVLFSLSSTGTMLRRQGRKHRLWHLGWDSTFPKVEGSSPE